MGRFGTLRDAILTATIYMADLSTTALINAAEFDWLEPEMRPAHICWEVALWPGTALEVVVIATARSGTS